MDTKSFYGRKEFYEAYDYLVPSKKTIKAWQRELMEPDYEKIR